MNTNGHGYGVEIQTPPEEIRNTEPCPPSLCEEGTGSLWKSVFIGVHPWFNRIVPAERERGRELWRMWREEFSEGLTEHTEDAEASEGENALGEWAEGWPQKAQRGFGCGGECVAPIGARVASSPREGLEGGTEVGDGIAGVSGTLADLAGGISEGRTEHTEDTEASEGENAVGEWAEGSDFLDRKESDVGGRGLAWMESERWGQKNWGAKAS